MKTETKKEIQITLTLNEREARYLMMTTQNYFGELEDEDPEEQKLRHGIFDGIKDALQR